MSRAIQYELWETKNFLVYWPFHFIMKPKYKVLIESNTLAIKVKKSI